MVAEALADGRGAETPGGIALVKRVIEPVANAIRDAVKNAKAGRPGPKQQAAKLLEKLDPEVAAYLTTKEVISAAMRGDALTATAVRIATNIEDELRLAKFEGEEPGLYHLLDRRRKERGSGAGHARNVFVFTANKMKMKLPTYTRGEKAQLGTKLIDIFIKAGGFITVVSKRRGKRLLSVIQPNEYIEKWIVNQNLRAEMLRPYYMPTVIPPAPWTDTHGGGYHTHHLLARCIVKAASKAHIEKLKAADMTVTHAGLNAIQNTAWKINSEVLDVMQDVWERGAEIAMPNRVDLLLPPKPHDIASNASARKAWSLEARRVHEANSTTRGKRINIGMMIAAAQEMRNDPAIYFPHQLDFRGRAYALPVGLNPQGSDQSKALLTFAEGKPVDERAMRWLLIHGANTFGFDKADFDERVSWATQRWHRALTTAKDPLADLWWTEADKPWCFLAWCFECQRVADTGMSSLPVSVDGSCNGLQHFSAMLRDPVGGAAVNLVPQEKPNDIYARVADRVIEKLREESDPEKKWIAQSWLQFGIDRKITKRPVMVLPYGGTFRSCMEYVRQAVNERIADGEANPFGEEITKATAYLSSLVWHSITDVVQAAREAMDWLQKVSRVVSKHKLPLVWTTPSGFVAYQAYKDVKFRRVRTRLQGSLVYQSLQEETPKIDAYRQALGISPNFVHSMDASAMMLTIARVQGQGVSQFAMIHDSYGTVAADMDKLAAALRGAFVDMYTLNNVLVDFLAALPDTVREECPPLPVAGALDLLAVRDSDFFFA